MKGSTISASNAEHFFWGDRCDGWILGKHPNASILQERMLPGTSETRHHHEKTWQFFFVLSGAMHIEIDGAEYEVKENEGIEVSPPLSHNIYNRTDKDLVYLLISAPHLPQDRINN